MLEDREKLFLDRDREKILLLDKKEEGLREFEKELREIDARKFKVKE